MELDLNLEGATTVGDVILLIRDHPLNQDTARVLVDLNEFGNGLKLTAPPDTGSLTVRRVGSSNAGLRLGWLGEDGADNVGSVICPVDTIIGAINHEMLEAPSTHCCVPQGSHRRGYSGDHEASSNAGH